MVAKIHANKQHWHRSFASRSHLLPPPLCPGPVLLQRCEEPLQLRRLNQDAVEEGAQLVLSGLLLPTKAISINVS